MDPYAGEGYDLPANLILVSHGHPDHNAVDLIENRCNPLAVHGMLGHKSLNVTLDKDQLSLGYSKELLGKLNLSNPGSSFFV